MSKILIGKKCHHNISRKGTGMAGKMFVIIILGSLFFLTCEKYINSQVDSQFNDLDIVVSGTVLNEFTKQPIYHAYINFGGRDTLTDPDGHFEISYRLKADDNRNKPVPFSVSANNYFDYQIETIVAPIDYTFNVNLVYAAPIVRNSSFLLYSFSGQEPLALVQSVLFDYQGADEIDTAWTTFFYVNDFTQERKASRIPMVFVEKISHNAAHYQSLALTEYMDMWKVQQNYEIYVEDSLGYSTSIQDRPPPLIGDTLIFPPIYYVPICDSIFFQ